MSGFQKLSDLAPVTMAALGNPKKENETQEQYVERICKILKVNQEAQCQTTQKI